MLYLTLDYGSFISDRAVSATKIVGYDKSQSLHLHRVIALHARSVYTHAEGDHCRYKVVRQV